MTKLEITRFDFSYKNGIIGKLQRLNLKLQDRLKKKRMESWYQSMHCVSCIHTKRNFETLVVLESLWHTTATKLEIPRLGFFL